MQRFFEPYSKYFVQTNFPTRYALLFIQTKKNQLQEM